MLMSGHAGFRAVEVEVDIAYNHKPNIKVKPKCGNTDKHPICDIVYNSH